MFENIKRFFGAKAPEQIETKAPGYLLETKSAGGGSSLFSAGTGGDTKYAGAPALLGAYRTSPWVRAVVSKISYHTAKVPLVLYEVKKGKNQKARGQNHVKLLRYKAATDPLTKARLEEQLVSEGVLEVVPNHPLLDLLRFPNEGMGGMAARQYTQGNIELTGQVYWHLFAEDDDKGKVPNSFVPYPVTWLRQAPTKGKPWFEFAPDRSAKSIVVPAENVITFRDLNLESPFGRGTGVGETLGDEIEIDEMSAKYTRNFFTNSARPDMLVSVIGESNPEALARLKNKIENNHRGWNKAHKALVVNKEIDLKVLNQKFSDLLVNDVRGAARDMITQVWGIPPEILGILQNSNRATVTESRAIFNDEVIVPRMDMFVDTLNTQLVPFYENAEGKDYLLGYIAPSREDKEERLAAMQAQPHTATVGEWRAAQGLEVREGDDVHMVPLGVQAVEDLGTVEAPKAPQPAPAVESDDAKAVKEGTPGPFVVREPRLQVVESSLEVLRPERLTAEAMPVWLEELPVWAQAALLDIGSDVAFNMLNPLVVGHLQEFAGDRIKDINETTKEQIRKTLVEGVRAGEGANQLAARVKSEFEGITTNRARTIARTETGNSSNFATLDAYRQSGIVDRVQWVATLDGRTRDAHAILNGEIVKLGDPFTSPMTGAQAFRPNGFGVAEDDINCRCTTVAVIEDPKSVDELGVIWKGYVEDIQTWETAAFDAFVRGFQQQEQDLLRAIERIFE